MPSSTTFLAVMSRPPLFPDQTASGIAVDPRTLERVVPESRRADGSMRKEIKIRPGFTPQEDVSRFRGTRQKAMDTSALPKGHIIGWAPPSAESKQNPKTSAKLPPPNKNAKRRANQRAKKAAEKAEAAVRDDWEDEEEGEGSTAAASGSGAAVEEKKGTQTAPSTNAGQKDTKDTPSAAEGGSDLADDLSKLHVK
ncbi:hypothetical protein ID866_1742 [Astraeus odoratus]|nr:hypothetical protein ID866_1742 [Astraeus odoratus]